MNDISPFRCDILDKVTGRAKYSGDMRVEGMLHAKILWPSLPSARILSLDLSKALQSPGVVRIITRKDITGSNLSGMYGIQDRPILVGEGEVVRNLADPLALVVAATEDEAERALNLIDVRYEPLQAVYTVDQAKELGHAPICTREILMGDIEAGFREAAIVVEGEYFNPYGEHAYIEPESGYAYIDHDETINVCVGSQDLRQQQRMVCMALGYPYHKVRLFSPYVGGGFGGKHSMSVHVYLALMAHILKRPVRLEWTREESIIYGCKKQELHARVRLGVDAQGCIVALKANVEGPSGPYLGNGGDSLGNYIKTMCGPYRHKNVDMRGSLYATTGLELAAFRGVGAPDAVTVIESLLDRAAKELGITPLEIRRRNWMRENHEFASQLPNAKGRNVSDKWLIEQVTLRALEEAGAPGEPEHGFTRGRGIACAMPTFCTGNTACHKGSVAQVTLYLDKTLLVRLGFAELGQGLSDMAVKLAAGAMCLDEAAVNVILADTHTTPVAGALGFSQATVTGGNAVLDAIANLKRVLCSIAREYLGGDDKDIVYADGDFYGADGSKVLGWEEFRDYCYQEVKSLTAEGCVTGSEQERNLYGVTSIACVADVDVNERTGEVKIVRIVQCHDTGKVLNHESARGQILGSAVMVVGGMLHEEFLMREGRALTPSLAEYLIPTAMDVPFENKAILLEGNAGNGCPNGAKAIGEHGMYSVGGAITNAIFDATGAVASHLPITPEKMLRALKKLS